MAEQFDPDAYLAAPPAAAAPAAAPTFDPDAYLATPAAAKEPAVGAGSSGGLYGQVAPLAYEAAKNFPKSAGKFAHDLVQPIIHPIDTATSLKNLGLGILQKVAPLDSGLQKLLKGGDYEKYADAAGQFLVDRYGSAEAVRKS
ncbi:MAG: hypothetical protein V4559_17695, partial [Pseudomonadota bacterium]